MQRLEESYQEIIGELAGRSKLTRFSQAPECDILTSEEGERFILRRARDCQNPIVEKICVLISRSFSEEEREPMETILTDIENYSVAYYIVEDEKKQVVALSKARYIELSDKEGMLFVVYIVVAPAFRKQGFAIELYKKMYRFAFGNARLRRQSLKGIIGETVEAVELFLNALGRKRVYYEDTDGNIREVAYVLPPLDWDRETGKPNRGDSSEHLMVRLLDGRQSFSVNELLAMVDGIYSGYLFNKKRFSSSEAFERHRQTIVTYRFRLRHGLQAAKYGRIFLMDADERARKKIELQKCNLQLIENTKKAGG